MQRITISMKYIDYLLFVFVGAISFSSCECKGPSYSPNTEASTGETLYGDMELVDDNQDDQYGDDDSSAYDNSGSDITKIRLTGEIVTCNKCMGYGLVQDGLYGQPEICKFCWVSSYMRMQQGWTGFDGRYGQVDAVFNTLPADYFNELDWNAGGEYEDDGGKNNTDQIEAEISRHEENIARLEHQLEYIEGTISRTQIEQQIIEEQYAVKRLRIMLNNM